jgi:hypothetical protein
MIFHRCPEIPLIIIIITDGTDFPMNISIDAGCPFSEKLPYLKTRNGHPEGILSPFIFRSYPIISNYVQKCSLKIRYFHTCPIYVPFPHIHYL